MDRTQIDMSQEAVNQRLRDVAELYCLGNVVENGSLTGESQ